MNTVEKKFIRQKHNIIELNIIFVAMNAKRRFNIMNCSKIEVAKFVKKYFIFLKNQANDFRYSKARLEA